MTTSFLWLTVDCALLCLLQVVAALPWLATLDPGLVKSRLRHLPSVGVALLATVGAGLVLALCLESNADPASLTRWGRIYAAILHLQVLADGFVLVFYLVLRFWPRGGAVALAAFREGIRQPMFWLLFGIAAFLMALSPLLPYFTFGEDFKMVQELGYDFTMLFSALFGIIAASTSIHEEIEGRTAITLISKPVSRRQFLLGKFGGILLAALVMTTLLGWEMIWVLLFKRWYDFNAATQAIPDPPWVLAALYHWAPEGVGSDFLRGSLLWVNEVGSVLPGLVLGFCQVMVLLAIAVALATRLPMIVTVPICLAVYFLGHLAPILMAVSQERYALVHFTAQLFGTLLPGLEYFSMGPAIVRDAPLPPDRFALYTANVSLYAVMYTAIALLFGLILFEDRDLA
jgi:ABC-type transport system involved in multi-copper enzyme maturation permease subunit